MSEDYYQILGIDKKASAPEIKKAYRKLALKYHPDKTKGDKTMEKKFTKLSEAYAVLSDPKKKNQYYTYGSADRDALTLAPGFGGANNWGGNLRRERGGLGGRPLPFDDIGMNCILFLLFQAHQQKMSSLNVTDGTWPKTNVPPGRGTVLMGCKLFRSIVPFRTSV